MVFQIRLCSQRLVLVNLPFKWASIGSINGPAAKGPERDGSALRPATVAELLSLQFMTK